MTRRVSPPRPRRLADVLADERCERITKNRDGSRVAFLRGVGPIPVVEDQ